MTMTKILASTLINFCLMSLGATGALALTIGSKDLTPNKTIGNNFVYSGMGCAGQNVSPEIHWSGAPQDTKSFAVTVYDPDAPTGSGFWHWVVYNIPATTTSLEQGWKSGDGKGTVAINDFGVAEYGGPCPPPGKVHHYIFTVHALKTDKIDLPAGATNAIARFMIEGATLQKGNFKALYGR